MYMSKLNEIIVSQLPTQSEVLPCTAYLLDNGDGTHDRYVSDEDGNLSKQSSNNSNGIDQENIPKLVNITLEDLGMTSENTEEEINQALSNYINGLNLTIDEKELYFFQVDGFTDGSSGSINQLIEVTYAELVNLKNTSSLVKGQNYLLTDYMTTYKQPNTGVMKSSGIVEPLILTAVSENQISNVCRSTLYPQDIVYYEITGNIGNGRGTEGFTKGKIYRRIDTQRNNDIGTDWRHVKYDRDGAGKLLFEDYSECYNNVIKTYYLFNNVVGVGFYSNTIGDNFNSNTIGNYFQENTIGNSFTNNTVGNVFNSNTIGDYFNSNTIGISFGNNIIGDYVNSNTIGNNFSSNTVGDYFGFNTIGIDINNNNVLFNSQNTEFRNYITNLTSSIEIQNNNIDVVVFKSPNGTLKQRYYDDSNNLVINNL